MSIRSVSYNPVAGHREVVFSCGAIKPLAEVLNEINAVGLRAISSAQQQNSDAAPEVYTALHNAYITIENRVRTPLAQIETLLKTEQQNRSTLTTIGRKLFRNEEGEKISPVLTSMSRIWQQFSSFQGSMRQVFTAIRSAQVDATRVPLPLNPLTEATTSSTIPAVAQINVPQVGVNPIQLPQNDSSSATLRIPAVVQSNVLQLGVNPIQLPQNNSSAAALTIASRVLTDEVAIDSNSPGFKTEGIGTIYGQSLFGRRVLEYVPPAGQPDPFK